MKIFPKKSHFYLKIQRRQNIYHSKLKAIIYMINCNFVARFS